MHSLIWEDPAAAEPAGSRISEARMPRPRPLQKRSCLGEEPASPQSPLLEKTCSDEDPARPINE